MMDLLDRQSLDLNGVLWSVAAFGFPKRVQMWIFTRFAQRGENKQLITDNEALRETKKKLQEKLVIENEYRKRHEEQLNECMEQVYVRPDSLSIWLFPASLFSPNHLHVLFLSLYSNHLHRWRSCKTSFRRLNKIPLTCLIASRL